MSPKPLLLQRPESTPWVSSQELVGSLVVDGPAALSAAPAASAVRLGVLSSPRETARDAAAGTREVGLDAARLLATFGIVFVHVAEFQGFGRATTAIGRFGTAFYIFVAVYFCAVDASNPNPRAFLEDAARRAKRILVPFAVWSAVYAAIAASHAAARGGVSVELTRWWGPLAGTALHLWFLPFAFCLRLVLRPLARLVHGWRPWMLFAATLVGGTSAYLFFLGWAFRVLDRLWLQRWHLHRFDRWLEELPFAIVCVGLTLLWVKRDQWLGHAAQHGGDREPKRVGWVPIVASACFLGMEWRYSSVAETLHATGWGEGRLFAHAGGLATAIVALALKPAWLSGIARLGRHTYFIFLSHVALLDLAGGFWWRVAGYGSAWFLVLSSVVIFVVGLALSVAVECVPSLARWLR